jgi:hypothetical protein
LNIDRPDPAKLIEYVKARGRSAERTVLILTKNYQHFSAVYNTEIGQDLLSYKIKRHNQLIEKILDKSIMPAGRDSALQEFFWIDAEIGMESKKINGYLEVVGKINK